MRLLANLELSISTDNAQSQKLFDQAFRIDDTDALTAALSLTATIVIPPNTIDQAVDFGTLTAASAVMLVASKDINVKINGIGAPAVPVRITPAAGVDLISEAQRKDAPGLVFWRGRITSIHVSNASLIDAAVVTIALVGNAA
jgi:hypothetical protein